MPNDSDLVKFLVETVLERKIVKRLSSEHWELVGSGSKFAVFDVYGGPLFFGGNAFDPLGSIADAFELQAKAMEGPRADAYVLRMYDAALDGLVVIGTRRLYRTLIIATARQRSTAIARAYGWEG